MNHPAASKDHLLSAAGKASWARQVKHGRAHLEEPNVVSAGSLASIKLMGSDLAGDDRLVAGGGGR